MEKNMEHEMETRVPIVVILRFPQIVGPQHRPLHALEF